ncbi:HRDC domain-containing protein [Candidatus Woesearchaeota archaeon]|nr:HRDC domain-containing protein [Candidatus Woesearchaeota archaeon]
MVNFEFIKTVEQLQKVVDELKLCIEIAVDVECENNLHHYGVFISLIQISSREKNWIVDVLKLKNIKPLLGVFECKDILKVFHDVGFDFRILKQQFSCNPKNVFDTQVAAAFLGIEHLGLGALLEQEFGFKKEKKFQRVDWTKRPLSYEMLQYAAHDTSYLLPLKDTLMMKLKEKGRGEWITEEMVYLEKRDYTYHEQEYKDLGGFRAMDKHERAILHVLFDERNRLAQKADRPSFMIMSNQVLLKLAVNLPKNLGEWKMLKGVHPSVRLEAGRLYSVAEAVRNGSGEELVIEKYQRMSIEQGELLKQLLGLRQEIAQKLVLKGYLLMDQEQARDIILSRSLASLRDWQRELWKNEEIVKKIAGS